LFLAASFLSFFLLLFVVFFAFCVEKDDPARRGCAADETSAARGAEISRACLEDQAVAGRRLASPVANDRAPV
jgi:hypothetical protein